MHINILYYQAKFCLMFKIPTTKVNVITENLILYALDDKHYILNLKTKKLYDASIISPNLNQHKEIVVIQQASFSDMVKEAINKCISIEKNNLCINDKGHSGDIDDKVYLIYRLHKSEFNYEMISIYLFSNQWFIMDPIELNHEYVTFCSTLHYLHFNLEHITETDNKSKIDGRFRLLNALSVDMPKNTIFKYKNSDGTSVFPFDITDFYHPVKIETLCNDSVFLISKIWDGPYQTHNNSLILNLRRCTQYSMPGYKKVYSHPDVNIFFFEKENDTIIHDLRNDSVHCENCTYKYNVSTEFYIYEPDFSKGLVMDKDKKYNTYIVPVPNNSLKKN